MVHAPDGEHQAPRVMGPEVWLPVLITSVTSLIGSAAALYIAWQARRDATTQMHRRVQYEAFHAERVRAIKGLLGAQAQLRQDFAAWLSPDVAPLRRSALESSVDRALSELERALDTDRAWVDDDICDEVGDLAAGMRRRHGLVRAAEGIQDSEERARALDAARREASGWLSGEYRSRGAKLNRTIRSAIGDPGSGKEVERRP